MKPQSAEQTQDTRKSDADILQASRTSDADKLSHERTSDASITLASRQSDAEALAVTRHLTINMIWERTQQGIAILCVTASVFSSVYLIVRGEDPLAERGYQFLTNVGLLVIGFYFGRTNHTRPTGESPDRRPT